MRTRLRERRRFLWLLVVVLGHALLILAMRQIAGPRITAAPEMQVLPITLTPLPAAPQSAAARNEQEPERPERARTAPDRVQSLVPPPPPQGRSITLPVDEVAGIPPSRDLVGDAARLADQLVNEAPDHRVFGPKQREAEKPREPERPDIFAPRTSRRAGDIQMLGNGLERRWVSPYCYRDFGGLPDFYAGRRTRLNPITCLRGSSEPRSDLFDELKPGYLRDEEE